MFGRTSWGWGALVMVATAALGCGDDTASGGAGGGNAGGGATGGGGAGGAATVQGCDGVSLLANPEDTSAPGPWPVGVRTAAVSGLTVEIWYPATVGSDQGATAERYDLRQWLPAEEAAKISDAKTPTQTCDCYRDLPLDDQHGPYPVVVFVHGTAGFRTQSLDLVTHWASRGFIVVAADHPGLYLGDLITSLPMCPGDAPAQDLAADLDNLIAAVKAPAGELAFLTGHADSARLATTGHSAGGGAVEPTGNDAQVVMPMAAGGVAAGSALASALILGAEDDKVVPFTNQSSGFDSTSAPITRLVGIGPAGHLLFSNLCGIQNADGEDMVTIGQAANVCGLALAGALFDCDASYVAEPRGFTIVNDATSAVLEETLHCAPSRAAWLDGIQGRYEEVLTYEHKP